MGPIDFPALWNFAAPAESEAKFRAMEEEARGSGQAAVQAEILTQIARAEGLQRRFDDAHHTLDAAAALAAGEGPDPARARVRVLLERGRVYNSSGRKDEAKPLFLEAWDAARAAGEEALAVDAAHMVAIVETPERAIEWNEMALEVAERASEPRARAWRGSLLNNLGWAHHGRGDFATALAAFELALAARREVGAAEPVRIARWCVARCLRSLGRLEEALAEQDALRIELEASGAPPDGYIAEEIGECLLALGRGEEARAHFARAHELLAGDANFAENEPQRLERLRTLGAGELPR